MPPLLFAPCWAELAAVVGDAFAEGAAGEGVTIGCGANAAGSTLGGDAAFLASIAFRALSTTPGSGKPGTPEDTPSMAAGEAPDGGVAEAAGTLGGG